MDRSKIQKQRQLEETKEHREQSENTSTRSQRCSLHREMSRERERKRESLGKLDRNWGDFSRVWGGSLLPPILGFQILRRSFGRKTCVTF